ncbi:DUF1330 domain-containing protein [Paracoccus sp. SY]|uniref:DUF1330 domain-containing protein n=1 Tax=Paracoccus sp. SY TaxID=1330255 RepID=UPI00352A5866
MIMTKGYWVAFADVTDPEGYKDYIAENAKAFRKYDGRFLTRGSRSEVSEGNPRSRVVVIEFPSFDAAVACYASPEYEEAMRLRAGKAIMDLAIVPGYEGQQPDETA